MLHRNQTSSLIVNDVSVLVDRELPYSRIIRFSAEFNDDSYSLPNNYVLKLAPGSTRGPQLETSASAEVEFYNFIAAEIGSPPLIRCFDAQFSHETGTSHILLEDLSGTHFQPEQNTPPSKSMSVLAVKSLAKCHAEWWNDKRLGLDVGRLFNRETLDRFVADLRSNFEAFAARSGVELSMEQQKAYNLMLGNADLIWGHLTDRYSLTVTHGDCHWWNFLYPIDANGESVRIFDWHLWHVDLGARDLAFLLALGGFAEPRPEIEGELLRVYHQTLKDEGVIDYPWEALLRDYRWSAIRNLNIPIIFWTQGKHETTWKTALKRAYNSYERLGCEQLIA